MYSLTIFVYLFIKLFVNFLFIFILSLSFSLYSVSSSKLIPFLLYVSINFSSIIDFSSSLIFPNTKLKNPINLPILVAKYPFWLSSKLSSLMSNIFIYVSEFGPIFSNTPSKFLHKFSYSLSGSITYCSIPNSLYLNISNFV